MTELGQTKVCPLCAETIKAAAKVCPHCRHWQKMWSLQNPLIGVILWVLVACVFMIGFGLLWERAFGPKKEFATYRDDISVLYSRFSCRTSGSNLLITVVGTLTNRSDVGWKNVGVEAQFLSKSGSVMDVIPVEHESYSGVVILPHGDAAFRIEGKAARPATDYDTYKLFVRWAKDADSFW